MPLSVGETFAGYTVLRLIGSGGMGEVYLVQHPRLPRQDALKVLRPDISGDAGFRERFIREADIAATLWHPNIVGVHDRGEYEGQLWIAMDYVDGVDAAQLIQRRYPAGMPADEVSEIVTAVASALDYAHERGLLHRDVKPANIMLTHLDTNSPQRRILLTDFGIARPVDDANGLTTTNMTMGTVAYAAPEQLMGQQIDGRADQYALAATAYHLLTGTTLFPHSNPAVVISQHLASPPPLPSQIRTELIDLDPVLAKSLSKKPAERYACCSDLARALADSLHTTVGYSPSSPTVEALKTPSRTAATPPPKPNKTGSNRQRWLIPAGLGAITALASATAWMILHQSSAESVIPPAISASAESAIPPAISATSSPTSPSTFAAPAPDPMRAPNGNCPPACTRIPDSAWIVPSTIPLYNSYAWPSLGPLSEPVTNPRLKSEEVCGSGPTSDDPRNEALAARVILPNPPGQWQLQVQILHWRGDPWIAGQKASAVMDAAATLLRDNCSFAAPGVSVSRISEQSLPNGHPGQSVMAVINASGEGAMAVHQFLVSDLRNSTIVEVSMWASSPSAVDWPPLNDDQLLADMVAPLCVAYVNSCVG